MWFRKVVVWGLLVCGLFSNLVADILNQKQTDFYSELYKNKLAVSSSVTNNVRSYHFYNDNALTYGLVDIDTFKKLNQQQKFLDTIKSMLDTVIIDGKKGLLGASYVKQFLGDNIVLKKSYDTLFNTKSLLTPLSSDGKLNLTAVRTDVLSSNVFGKDFLENKHFEGVIFNRRATLSYFNAPQFVDDTALVGAMFTMALDNTKDTNKIKKILEGNIVKKLSCGLVGATTLSKVLSETYGNISTLESSESILEYNQNKGNITTFLNSIASISSCNDKINSDNFRKAYESKDYLDMLAQIGTDEYGLRKEILNYSPKLAILVEASKYVHELMNALYSYDKDNNSLSAKELSKLLVFVNGVVVEAYIKEYLDRKITNVTDKVKEKTLDVIKSNISSATKKTAKKLLSTANFLNIGFGQLHGEIFTPDKIYFDLYLDDNGVPYVETGNIAKYVSAILPLNFGGDYNSFFSFDDYDKINHIYPKIDTKESNFAMINQPILVQQGYESTINSDVVFNQLDHNMKDLFRGNDNEVAISKSLSSYKLGRSTTSGKIKWFKFNDLKDDITFSQIDDAIQVLPSTMERVCRQLTKEVCSSTIPFVKKVSFPNVGAYKYDFNTKVFNTINNQLKENLSAKKDFRFYVLPKYNSAELVKAYNEEKELRYDLQTETLFISQDVATKAGGFYRLNTLKNKNIWQIRLAVRDKQNSTEFVEIEYNSKNYFEGVDAETGKKGLFIKIPKVYFGDDTTLNVAIYDPVLSAFVDIENKDLTDVLNVAHQYNYKTNSLNAFEFRIIKREDLLVEHEEEIEDTIPSPSTLLLTLPDGATIKNNNLKAPKGETISFQGGITASEVRWCVQQGGDGGTYELWYTDVVDGKRKSVPLDFDRLNNTFSFVMPSSEIVLIELHYNNNIDDEFEHRDGFCPLPDVLESIDNNTSTEENNNTNNQTVNLTNGLVAHYEFEGDANDSSGNGNYGTEHGEVSYVDGVIGKAGSFDGVDDYITIKEKNGFQDFNNPQRDFTISAFVYYDENSLGTIYSNTTEDGWHHLSINNDHLMNFGIRDTTWHGTSVQATNVNMDSWHSMTVSYKNNIMYIYIDGILKSSKTFDGSVLSSGGWDNGGIRIGVYYLLDKGYFKGKIDDLRIYNRALNEAEIKALYKKGQVEETNQKIIIDDDFSEPQINRDNWLVVRHNRNYTNMPVDYSSVSIEDGKLYLLQDRTDDGPQVHSKPFLVPQSGKLVIERRLKASYANNNFRGRYYLMDSNKDTLNGDWFHEGVDGFCIVTYDHDRYDAPSDNFTLGDQWFTPVWNEYFDEKLTYDFQTHIGTYTLNGVTKSYQCKAPKTKYMKIMFDAFGWWTGHEMWIDNMKVYIDNASYASTNKINSISLLDETHQDGTFIKKPFTKQWTFNKDLTDLNITILENSYQNTITSSDLIKDGKTLKVNLTPNTNSAINKLVLQFKNSNGEIVKVSGSKTFWSLTKTNHKPRLADGQITRLVGVGSSYLDIETYDSDGDSVTLSVEESAGGSVSLNGNRVSASFSDGKVVHTIKIGLDDGKEKVVKTFTVIDFSQNSIENFYSDVDTNSSHFKAIAFATLKGVVGGQIDPNDETKRVFRPDDEVSLAEALKMVINAERKAGLIELTTADAYMKAYPKWAMKYYTFAREKGALDREQFDLAIVYPSREVIAKLIVKTLDLDSKLEAFGELNFAFSDEDDFSDAQLRHYGEIAHIFGLFMLDDQANPQSKISRAELAEVIRTIFMIPKAELVLDPVSVEQGEGNITATLGNVSAQNINGSYELYDSSSELTMALTSNSRRLSNPIDSEGLSIGENVVYAFFDNHGVRGVAQSRVNIGFSDQDSDGIQDRDDKWSDDTRYAYDDNGNGIPDILDIIYNLGDYNATDSVEINGVTVSIKKVIEDGGFLDSNSTIDLKDELSFGKDQKVLAGEESNITILIDKKVEDEFNLSVKISDDSTLESDAYSILEGMNFTISDKPKLQRTIKIKDNAVCDDILESFVRVEFNSFNTSKVKISEKSKSQTFYVVCHKDLRGTIKIKQQNRQVSTIHDTTILVDIVATTNSDELTYDWSNSSQEILSYVTNDLTDSNLTLKLEGIEDGSYDIVLKVSNQKGETLTIARKLIVKQDNSNIESDEDGDGISDAFDTIREPNILQTEQQNETNYLLQVREGEKLELGDIAKEQNRQSASIDVSKLPKKEKTTIEELFDFKVTGLSRGESTIAILPLKKSIPSDAIYLKYSKESGWRDFVVDDKNKVESAKALSQGVCPAINSSVYKTGLTKGDNCIRLTIEDGGANDNDGVVNGEVLDPSGVGQKETKQSGNGGSGSSNSGTTSDDDSTSNNSSNSNDSTTLDIDNNTTDNTDNNSSVDNNTTDDNSTPNSSSNSDDNSTPNSSSNSDNDSTPNSSSNSDDNSTPNSSSNSDNDSTPNGSSNSDDNPTTDGNSNSDNNSTPDGGLNSDNDSTPNSGLISSINLPFTTDDGKKESVNITSDVDNTTQTTNSDGTITITASTENVKNELQVNSDGTLSSTTTIGSATSNIEVNSVGADTKFNADGSITISSTVSNREDRVIRSNVEIKANGETINTLNITAKDGTSTQSAIKSDIAGTDTIIADDGSITMMTPTITTNKNQKVNFEIVLNASGEVSPKLSVDGIDIYLPIFEAGSTVSVKKELDKVLLSVETLLNRKITFN